MARFHGGLRAGHGIGSILLLGGFVLLGSFLAALPRLVVDAGALLFAVLLQSEGAGAENGSNAETTTRRLLDALSEKRMDDVVIQVLDRVAADPATSADFRRSLLMRRATALSSLARREPPGARRVAMLEQAAQEVDRCLAAAPTGDEAVAAYTQKGNLFVEQGRIKLAQAKRPGEDAAKLMAEAMPLFDGAIAALEAPPREPGAEPPPPTNAEDAVLASLREVDARLAQLKNTGKEKEGNESSAGKKARRPAKKSSTDVKAMERLEDRQDELRGECSRPDSSSATRTSRSRRRFRRDRPNGRWLCGLRPRGIGSCLRSIPSGGRASTPGTTRDGTTSSSPRPRRCRRSAASSSTRRC